ncbi:SCP2 sterol-binding domain-containing protein [Humibacillus xanthopallidus]|uniref:SCP-2 sterol transfer family protein n=1 Tax=Humibacillus xanthopallidus TaxID=412689 RepID=A0A543I1L2_9MICO|nr:SCP2 sterol-binding domain-containing protein [Humibacillus xanthopallidus]TQM64478.1 SCP-2 sterol transfer family protein [Humibacillus xanthopallidus]
MPAIDFRTATPDELAAIDPADFIDSVKAMSDRELKELMEGPNRGPIIESIFTRMPQIFRPERAGSASATTHWTLTGGPDGGSDDYTVRVADGVCTVLPGHDGDSTLGLTMAPVDFIKLITKTGNPVMMFMTGKLKARGDVALAANLAGWFDVPSR